ncbi:hypothetical protein QFC20_000462 [Naganishia adeliensis]|uniref:Uncharacterized protein n=1 Tax=Naganishia adeliensis TaxID=92952 RepID=A0ACC2X1P2_9TREE|nr:hypothetical protein QFC20_000462 [Naganishia adeliensis]
MGDPTMMQQPPPPSNAQYYGADPNQGAAGYNGMQPHGQYPPNGEQYAYGQGQQPMGYGQGQPPMTGRGEQDFTPVETYLVC